MLLACVFLMGLHSTLFGPVKYAYLPQHLDERELTGGNGMVEMGTFVAILLGNVAGGLLVACRRRGARYVAVACVAVAVLGRITAQFMPHSPAPDPRSRSTGTRSPRRWRNLQARARKTASVFHSLLGISWLWFFGSIFLTAVHVLREGRAARRRERGLAAAGGVLGRHRHRLAAVRDAVGPARSRSASCRSAPSA